jgi:hypothetical protein
MEKGRIPNREIIFFFFISLKKIDKVYLVMLGIPMVKVYGHLENPKNGKTGIRSAD